MKQVTTTHFQGLSIQPNSFDLPPGAFETLDNASCIYESLVQKRRGLYESYQLPDGQLANLLFEYQNLSYILTGDSLYRIDDVTLDGQFRAVSGSATIIVRYALHQILNNDYVSNLAVDNTDAFVAAFPTRANAFYGIKKVTTNYAVTGTRLTNVVTITTTDVLNLQVGDGVQFTTSALAGVSTNTTYVVTSTPTPTTFTFANAGSNVASPAALTLYTQDQFAYTAFETATASVLSGATAGHFRRYIKQSTRSNSTISTTALPYSRHLAANLNAYFLTDNGVFKLDYDIANVQKAGLPPQTSVQAIIGTAAGGIALGNRLGYRAIYTRTDANNNLLLSAPGEIVDFSFPLIGSSLNPSNVIVRVWLADGIREGDSVRLYRTSQVLIAATPPADYRLSLEYVILAADVTRGYVILNDYKKDADIASNPLLYTNPNQETEAQAAYPPPYCQDVAVYKNYTCFANFRRPQSLQLNLISTDGISINEAITIGNTTYNFRINATSGLRVGAVGNEINTDSATVAGTTVTITHNDHAFGTGDYIYVEGTAGGITGVTAAEYQITVLTANTFSFVSTPVGAAGNVTYFGTKNNAGVRLIKAMSTSAVSLGVAIFYTADYIVQAVNQYAPSDVYANNLTPINGTPGLMQFTEKNVSASTFTVAGNAVADQFFPALTATSFADEQPAGICFSKVNEPESSPLLQRLIVGAQNAPILRIHAIRDSLLVIKTDGIWRVNGSAVQNFSVSILDSTVLCRAVNSSVVLNNSVYFMSNQGVVQSSDSSVAIISRPIEPLLTNILSKDLTDNTFGVAYESERLYIMTTLRANQTTPDINYVYNYLTNSWSTWSGSNVIHRAGELKTGDVLSWANYDSPAKIYQERKEQDLTDYVDDEYAVRVFRSLISPAISQTGSPLVTVTSPYAHGLTTGDLVTIERETVLDTVFSSASNVNGLRTATVLTPYVFTFNAAVNAISYVSGTVNYNRGINQFSIASTTVSGSNVVVFNTVVNHGLSSGDTIYVQSTTLTSLTSSQITGPRSIVVTSSSTFQVIADGGASANQTAACVVSDSRVNKRYLTVYSWELTPQVGDGLLYQQTNTSSLIKMTDVTIQQALGGSVGIFAVVTLTNYEKFDTDLVYVSQGITSRVKFVPQTAGDTGMLKYFCEFQSAFRNAVACTKMTVNFGNDSKISTTGTDWDFRANSSKTIPNFFGWGAALWSEVPWGSDAGTLKQYQTGPASILRTLLPKEVFVGTFLQPSFIHRVAGESIDLQSISMFIRATTQRTSR